MADDELRLDLFVDGKDEAADKTEEIADNLDRVGETLDELKEKKIDILDEDQLKRLIELEKTLTKINIQIDRLEGRKRKTLGGDLEITQKLVDKHKTEKEIAIMTGQPQEETDRLQREIEKEQAREREIRDQIDRNIEAAGDRLDKDRDRRDEQPGEAPPPKPPKPPRPPGAGEEDEDEEKKPNLFAAFAKFAALQAMTAAGVSPQTIGLSAILGGGTGGGGMGALAGLTGASALAFGLPMAALSIGALIARVGMQRTEESRDIAAEHAIVTHQLSRIKGIDQMAIGHLQTYGEHGSFGVMPMDRLRYSRELADVFGGGFAFPERYALDFAITSGMAPSAAVSQMARLRRVVGDDYAFLPLLGTIETIRHTGNVEGRGNLVMDNLYAMSQAHLAASGIMPTGEQATNMLNAYAALAETGETGAMFGSQFYSRFTGVVGGASGSTNAFLLRAFLNDPGVTSHTLEDFEYWKEQVAGDDKVGYIMNYATKEFGENAGVALKRMGLATIGEYREYTKEGGITSRRKKYEPSRTTPDKREMAEMPGRYLGFLGLKQKQMISAGYSEGVFGQYGMWQKELGEFWKGFIAGDSVDLYNYRATHMKGGQQFYNPETKRWETLNLVPIDSMGNPELLYDGYDYMNHPVATPTPTPRTPIPTAIPTSPATPIPQYYPPETPTAIVTIVADESLRGIAKIVPDESVGFVNVQEGN